MQVAGSQQIADKVSLRMSYRWATSSSKQLCSCFVLGLIAFTVITASLLRHNTNTNRTIGSSSNGNVNSRRDKILAEIREDIIAGKYASADRIMPHSETTTQNIKRAYRVPNVIHYVILFQGARVLGFTEYVSVLSAIQNHNPTEIWIHCNPEPTGRWWEQLVLNVSWRRIRVVHVHVPIRIGETVIGNADHARDVAKLQILARYGGIYLDTDVIVIQNLDPFRIYRATFGQESAVKLSPAVVLAEPNSTFIRLILDMYATDYHQNDPDYNTGTLPYKLSRRNPDSVYVEVGDLIGPGLSRSHLLFSDNQALLDWRRFHTVHLCFHGNEGSVYNPDYIRDLKSVVGKILKYIYYRSEHGNDPYKGTRFSNKHWNN